MIKKKLNFFKCIQTMYNKKLAEVVISYTDINHDDTHETTHGNLHIPSEITLKNHIIKRMDVMACIVNGKVIDPYLLNDFELDMPLLKKIREFVMISLYNYIDIYYINDIYDEPFLISKDNIIDVYKDTFVRLKLVVIFHKDFKHMIQTQMISKEKIFP